MGWRNLGKKGMRAVAVITSMAKALLCFRKSSLRHKGRPTNMRLEMREIMSMVLSHTGMSLKFSVSKPQVLSKHETISSWMFGMMASTRRARLLWITRS